MYNLRQKETEQITHAEEIFRKIVNSTVSDVQLKKTKVAVQDTAA